MSDSFNKSKPGSSATLGLRRFISRFKDGGPATASSTQQAQQVLQGDAPVHSEGAPQAEIIEKDVILFTKMCQIRIRILNISGSQ